MKVNQTVISNRTGELHTVVQKRGNYVVLKPQGSRSHFTRHVTKAKELYSIVADFMSECEFKTFTSDPLISDFAKMLLFARIDNGEVAII